MRIVASKRRKQPSAEPPKPEPAEDRLAFHVPTRGRCTCQRCVAATRNGPICQCCHLPWPCPDADVKECGDFDR